MKRKQNVIAIVLEWVLAIAIGGIMAYFVLKNLFGEQRPLTQADIPQSTIDWFNGLWNDSSDVGGVYDSLRWDSTDWNRYEDIDSMHRLEDNLFVIFYSTKDSVVERNKALICQRYAHEAVPVGELFMKKYPYPDSLNGRKLPIYLAKTVKDFRSICEQLGHGDPGTWAIGLYCFRYGLDGVITDGVILSSEAWEVPDHEIGENTKDERSKQVLWHEMNHFMYFSNWDYTQTSHPFVWFYEGLAEYFSNSYGRLYSVGDCDKLNLEEDFRGGINDDLDYWAGMTAYLCLEQKFNKSKVSDVVSNSYKNSIEKAVKMAIPNYSLKSWNNDWHTFMENKEYKKYMH